MPPANRDIPPNPPAASVSAPPGRASRPAFHSAFCTRHSSRAFTLVELLVVVAIVTTLLSIMLPSLRQAHKQARATVCKSNLHQLHLANSSYAVENRDLYVPAASDMLTGFGGRHRWHGVRLAVSVHPDPEMNTFDPLKGPLASSLLDGKVKQCPERVRFIEEGTRNAFEAGTGGYGYNLVGVGSRFYQSAWSHQELHAGRQYLLGWTASGLKRPAGTIMFTDTAFKQYHSKHGDYLTEYSFCEPPWSVSATVNGPQLRTGQPPEMWLMVPTIHFRHAAKTNVAWCDGHVASERPTYTKADLDQWNLGWFGPKDNSLFDPH